MAKKENSFELILNDLKQKKYAPVYLLMGEEAFYIDQISDFIQKNVLDDMQKEFDLTVLYGKDTDITTVINASKRFPMLSTYQVVILKEAQLIKNLDMMELYLNNIASNTILVICYKYGTVDGRKKWVGELKRKGVVMVSEKLRDYEMPSWIGSYARSKSIQIEEKALILLVDFLGTDLTKVVNEIDKLSITISDKSQRITPEIIEKNIGISKDYNFFELQDALINRDILKANRIVRYFGENKKANPVQMILAQLFGFFSNLMLFHYLPEKTADAAASEFKIHPFIAKNYVKAAQTFNAWKTMNAIGWIRETDARSKGVNDTGTEDGDLLKELVFKLLH
jgi:DNA polymerase-3 subunit delta